jgi:hypothetical protein
MSKQRRTADDFVRDMKARQQQHSTAGDVRAQNQRRADPRTDRRVARKPGPHRLADTHCGGQEHPQPPKRFVTKGSPLPAAVDR